MFEKFIFSKIMYKGLRTKFKDEKLRQKLLATGNSIMLRRLKTIEDSPIDSYWGCGKDSKSENKLGMRTRNHIFII